MNPALAQKQSTLKPSSLLARGIPAGLDVQLIFIALALVSIGTMMVISSSISFAEHTYGDGFYFMKRHMIYLVLGLIAALVVLQVPVRTWYRYSDLVMVMSLVLLAAVLVPGIGREVNGARRWIGLGILNLQVAELAKLAMIVFMGGYLHRHQLTMKSHWLGFLKPMGMLLLVGMLLLLQPDFGSAVVIGCTVLGLMFLGGMQLWIFAAMIAAASGGLAMLAITSPYRMERLVTFLDPWADMFDSGYQLTQSLIAFGRGEWLGVGLGNSVQKLFYLPEAHTDFVFAIFAEEFGLFGVALVIGLFVTLVYRILWAGRKAVRRQDWFAAYTAFGIGILIAGQAFINIGVTSGLLPTKGLTLPFVSYGGSSLLVTCMMIALVLRIGMEMGDQAWAQNKAWAQKQQVTSDRARA